MSVRGFNTGSGVEQYDYEYLDNKPEIPTKKSDIGLGNVDNTSDLDKPISNATQTALNEKVPNTRKVNGKALSADVTLTSGDIGYDGSSAYDTGTVGKELTELNRQISDSKSIIDNGIRSIYPTMLFPATAMSRGNLDAATFIDGHSFGTVTADSNIVITGNENLVPNTGLTASMPDGYFSVFLPEGTYIMHVLCGYAEYASNARLNALFYAEKTERVPRYVQFTNCMLTAGSECTATFQVTTGWYLLRLYFLDTTPINIKYWLTKAETSVTAMLLENM